MVSPTAFPSKTVPPPPSPARLTPPPPSLARLTPHYPPQLAHPPPPSPTRQSPPLPSPARREPPAPRSLPAGHQDHLLGPPRGPASVPDSALTCSGVLRQGQPLRLRPSVCVGGWWGGCSFIWFTTVTVQPARGSGAHVSPVPGNGRQSEQHTRRLLRQRSPVCGRSSHEGLWKPLECFCRRSSLRLAGAREREDGRHGRVDGRPHSCCLGSGCHHGREGRRSVAGRGLTALSREHGRDTALQAGEQVAQCCPRCPAGSPASSDLVERQQNAPMGRTSSSSFS